MMICTLKNVRGNFKERRIWSFTGIFRNRSIAGASKENPGFDTFGLDASGLQGEEAS